MPQDVRVYDLLTRTESIPFPEGPDVVAATAKEVVYHLEPEGWSVCLNGKASWLFTNEYGQAARLWCLPDGVWRLSADPGFLDTALKVLGHLASVTRARRMEPTV